MNDPGLVTIPFGRYQGRQINDIPSNYLKWIIDNVENNDELVEAATEEYQFRNDYRNHFWN